jgi:hypothetical protein
MFKLGLALIATLATCTVQPDGTIDQDQVWLVEEDHTWTPEEAAQVNSGDQLNLLMLPTAGWEDRCLSYGGTPTVQPVGAGVVAGGEPASTDPESGDVQGICEGADF